MRMMNFVGILISWIMVQTLQEKHPQVRKLTNKKNYARLQLIWKNYDHNPKSYRDVDAWFPNNSQLNKFRSGHLNDGIE